MAVATNLLRRAIALISALLLAFVVASPAIAEIGCSWDTATHFAGAEHDDGHEAEASEHEEPGSKSDPGDVPAPDSHCAFSHGHGDLGVRSAEPVLIVRLSSFTPPDAAAFVSSAPSGLERPPRG